MKKLVLAALLLAVPAFGADSTPSPKRTVREFVLNNGPEDWWLNGGWTWSEGTLTHWPGSGQTVAELRTMPPLTAGRTYGIDLGHDGSTKGSVTVSLGKSSSVGYVWRGTFPLALTVSDPDALLTLTPTNDYNGSISRIRVVELGDELVGETALTRDSSHEGVAHLSSAVPVVAGHSYRVYFNVSEASEADPRSRRGTVAIGGQRSAAFSNVGNYSFDLAAINDSPLIIDLEGTWFDGVISRVSVREIVTDPVPSEPMPRKQ